MRKFWIVTLNVCFASSMLVSCVSVKPYQKAKLNDSEMVLSARPSEKYQNNFLLYREGASGGNGGRTGGGCGCN